MSVRLVVDVVIADDLNDDDGNGKNFDGVKMIRNSGLGSFILLLCRSCLLLLSCANTFCQKSFKTDVILTISTWFWSQRSQI